MMKKVNPPIGSNEIVLYNNIKVLWGKECHESKMAGELFVTNQRMILSRMIPRFFRKDLVEYYSIPFVNSANIAITQYPRRSFFGESNNGEIQIVSKGEFADVEFVDSEDFINVTNRVYCLITGSSSGIVPLPKTFGDKVLDAMKETAGFFFGDVVSQGHAGSGSVGAHGESRAGVTGNTSIASQRSDSRSAVRQPDDDVKKPASSNEGKGERGTTEGVSRETNRRTHAARTAHEGERRGMRTSEKVVVQCQTCGARFAGVRGRMKQCDYCGNPIRF